MPKSKSKSSPRKQPGAAKKPAILAIDLAWDGETGWCLWDDEAPDPIVEYGTIKPKYKRSLSGSARVFAIAKSIQTQAAKVAKLFSSKYDFQIVYEETDWHQDLTTRRGLKKNWRQLYAQERTVQRTLGRAEIALLSGFFDSDIEIESIGAAEAKREFGAMKKEAVMELIAAEHPRFTLMDNWAGLRDKNGEEISHNVCDAIAIASVVARRKYLERRIAHSSS